MTKDELKQYIGKLGLTKELEQELYRLIDEEPEITQEFLDKIASILEFQADVHEDAAKLYKDRAQEREKLAEDLEKIEKQADEEELKTLEELNEKLKPQSQTVTAVEPKSTPAPVVDSSAQKTEDAQKMEEVRQVITASADASAK